MPADDLSQHVGALLDVLASLVAEKLAQKGGGVPQAPPAALVPKQGLAAALGISPTQVDRLVRDGRIPFFNIGATKRFDVVAVREALQAKPKPGVRKAEPEAEPENLDALVRYGRTRGTR
jgi:hypothetical protein